MAYLNPASGEFLGPGGHLKMHQVVQVEENAPTGAVKIDENGNLLVLGNIDTVAAQSGNPVDNPLFRVDQVNSGASVTVTAGAALAYNVDRHWSACTGANVTAQRLSAITGGYRYTGAASVTAIKHGHRIDALASAHLAGKTITVSVDTDNTVLTSMTWYAYYANTKDVFGTLVSPTKTQIATGSVEVSSTRGVRTFSFAVPSGAVNGIEIVLQVGAQTSGTWTLYGIQIDEGTVARPIATPDPWDELTRCMRRQYVFLPGLAVGQGYIIINPMQGAQSQRFALPILPVEMAANPTTTFYTSNGTAGALTEFASGLELSVSGTYDVSRIGGGYVQLSTIPTYSLYLKAIYRVNL
jgi:hypothetical protein